MAQISDVMHASALFDAARQELAWAFSGEFADVPAPMKKDTDAISKVLNEAEMRWLMTLTSSGEEKPMAVVVDKENAMAVVATGHGEEKKKKVVKEVGRRSIGEAERKIKRWMVRLEEVACDMRAVARKELLGDYSRIDHDKLSARWLPCLPRTTRRAARIAPTIDTVALKLGELKKQYDKELGHSTGGLPLAATCCTEQPACSSAAGGQEERETSVTGNVLLERDNDAKQRIIDIINGRQCFLDNDDYGVATVLPIFGPPCVGKTTLAKLVFHDHDVEADYKVWVDMRKGWDIKKVLESIIELSGRHHFSGQSEADCARYIYEMLESKRKMLLLFLDNMVESDFSEEPLSFLCNCKKYVCAIVITPSEAFATKYNPETVFWLTTESCRLHPCSDDMCWEIIKQTSGLDLEATAAGTSKMDGCEIVSKCSGRSLAAKALGGFLQSVNPNKEWPDLIRDVWNIGGGFSRYSLPTHSATVFAHLKMSVLNNLGAESWLSLAYCAFFLFPKGKGHGVVTRDLLNQWCSLGITTRERGASCISELLDRWYLLGEKPNSYASEDVILLRMEDLMHDFARYHLGDRLIIVDGTNGATPPTSSSPVNNNNSSTAYLALVSNFNAKQLDISSILPAGILALRFEGCGGEMELSDDAFASFGKYLRLLDLSGYSEKKMLPDFIRHLKQLTYLKAPGIQDQELPRFITGLHELRYLILHGSCQLKDLTEVFPCLSSLLHLDLSGCSGLKGLPDSFGRLWRLEYLDLSECSGIEALPESFGWLLSLRHLDLSRCSGLKALPESFGGLNRLWHLDLSRCSGLQDLPKSFQDLTELRHLDLSGMSRLQELPMDSPWPRELRHLNLSGCSGLQEKSLPEAPVPNSELQHLDLSGWSSVSDLPSSYPALQKLVHLNLSGCSSLIKLPELWYCAEWIWRLEHLDLSYCSQLSELPRNIDLVQLQYLDLSGCSSLGDRYLFRYESDQKIYLVETIRSRGGRASGPEDASLRELGTSGTTN